MKENETLGVWGEQQDEKFILKLKLSARLFFPLLSTNFVSI